MAEELGHCAFVQPPGHSPALVGDIKAVATRDTDERVSAALLRRAHSFAFV